MAQVAGGTRLLWRKYGAAGCSTRKGRLMHKVWNEQVKTFAAALNNLGVGAIITAIVTPTVNGRVGDWEHTALGLYLCTA